MSLQQQFRLFLQIAKMHGLARRYFVVNGFDGALTMLGIIMGFYVNLEATVQVALSACFGAAVALAISGITSAYISESAERQKDLKELENAMARNLEESAHGKVAKIAPIIIAIVNGMSPFVIAVLIMSPLWLSSQTAFALPAFESAIVLAFVVLFFLGVFLGKVSGKFWLWSGVRTLLIAIATAAIVFFVNL